VVVVPVPPVVAVPVAEPVVVPVLLTPVVLPVVVPVVVPPVAVVPLEDPVVPVEVAVVIPEGVDEVEHPARRPMARLAWISRRRMMQPPVGVIGHFALLSNPVRLKTLQRLL
jgi:hypothetical protein